MSSRQAVRGRQWLGSGFLALLLVGPAFAAGGQPEVETIFEGDFETGDSCAWSSSIGDDLPCVRSIYEIQTGAAAGSLEVQSAVVTAISVNGRSFWLADAASAAAWSGIFVYRAPAEPPVGAVVGDLLTVDGTVSEFATLTEILPDSIVAAGGGASPVPVTNASVETLAGSEAGEPYEGVLVRVNNVRVVAVGAGNQITLADNSGHSIVMDDVAWGYNPVDYPVLTCIQSVTGVMHVDTVNGIRVLAPRFSGDIQIPGGSCV